MSYGDHLVLQKTQRGESSLTVGLTIVLRSQREAAEYLLRVGEINAMLPNVRTALGLVPREQEPL